MQVKVLTFETGSCTVSGPSSDSSQRETFADELVVCLFWCNIYNIYQFLSRLPRTGKHHMGLKRTLIGSLLFKQFRSIIFWLNVSVPMSIDISSLKKEHRFLFFSFRGTRNWTSAEDSLKATTVPSNWKQENTNVKKKKQENTKLPNPTLFSLVLDQLLLYIHIQTASPEGFLVCLVQNVWYTFSCPW